MKADGGSVLVPRSARVFADLRPGEHACFAYASDNEHRKLLVRFLRQGFARGEKVIYCAPSERAEVILDYLKDDGAWVEPYLQSKQLSFLPVEGLDIGAGSKAVLTCEGLAASYRAIVARGVAEGYPSVRITVEMGSLLHYWQVIEQGALLSAFFHDDRCTLLCQYDRRRFDPASLLCLLAAHRLIVVGDRIFENALPELIGDIISPGLEAQARATMLWGGASGHELYVQRRTEEALQESKERYQVLVETSPDAIALSDVNGNILMVNRHMLDLMGYESAEEIIGRSLFDLAVPQDRLLLAAAVEKMETGVLRDLELVLSRKDNTSFPVEVSISAIRNIEGKIKSHVAVLRDITERKCLEEQFRQAQKMEVVGRLAGGVAHDFNNLLTVLQGSAQFALESLPPGSTAREDIEQVIQVAERAADLTRQLLIFSRRQVLDSQIVDLNDLIMGMDKMLRRLIGEDINLLTIPASCLGRVKVDPGQIEQVLVNLVVNARDAMPTGGVLTIETANVTLDELYGRSHLGVTPGEFVMLAVSDTGIGMTPEIKSHLFEPFFTTKEPGKGTGLGLATIYGIVKQHGGDIRVYSEVRKGTTFKVYLPQIEEQISISAPDGQGAARPKGSETVLVVEDDLPVRNLTVRTLRALGYTVLEAATGQDALQTVQKYHNQIHLLLTDVIMPQMSGRELARQLVALHPRVKTLYASGYTEDAIASHGVLDEDTAFLSKPFTADALAHKVRQVLEQG